jgi:hypothetical protein
MIKNIVVIAVILCSSLVGQNTIASTQTTSANDCKKWTITAVDGYANVRSTPKVRINNANVIGILVTGTGVRFNKKSLDWVGVDSPVTGWMSRSQITQMSCDASIKLLLKTGLPTITKLGVQASRNNIKSAIILIKIAPGVDGVTAEAYGIAIADWAKRNPQFLISTLKKQPSSVYQPFLDSLKIWLSEPQAKKDFEAVLNQLSSSHPMVKYWFTGK